MRSQHTLSAPRLLIFPLLLVLAISACTPLTGSTYSSSQARTAYKTHYGKIVQLADATIDETVGPLGALGGAVAGGILGSLVGGGKGRVLTTMGGAALGGLAGAGAEKSINKRQAVEITVALDNGENLTIVQEKGNEEANLVVGDRVRVMRGPDGSARVRR